MRNQYMAKVLVHNKVVSEAQIQAHWGEITDKKDIGQVLVDAGVLQPPVYIKLLAFVKNLEAKAAAENAAAPAAEAPASSTSAKVSAPSMRTMASKPGESSASASDDAGGLQIEGNNPYGETTSTTNMEVETVTGLEATSIARCRFRQNMMKMPKMRMMASCRLVLPWLLERVRLLKLPRPSVQ